MDKRNFLKTIAFKIGGWLVTLASLRILYEIPLQWFNSTLIKNQIALGQMTNSNTEFLKLEVFQNAYSFLLVLVSIGFVVNIVCCIHDYFNKEN